MFACRLTGLGCCTAWSGAPGCGGDARTPMLSPHMREEEEEDDDDDGQLQHDSKCTDAVSGQWGRNTNQISGTSTRKSNT